MHDLNLESILDRLLLTAEGVVREHVCKVLWGLRDEPDLVFAAKQMIVQVGDMRKISERNSWAKPVGTDRSRSGRRAVSLRFTAGLRRHQLDQEMYAAWNWMRETFVFDKMQRSVEAQDAKVR